MKKTFTFILALTLLTIFGAVNAQNNNGINVNTNANVNANVNASGSASATSSSFGNGFWNVYCYDGNVLNSTAIANFEGTYTENNLTFDSRNRWVSTETPSSANANSGRAYTGSNIGIVHTVTYKRQNFICGYYKIDIAAHDNHAYLIINGITVWSHLGCCDSHTDVWMGFLDANSTVEFKWVNFEGRSMGAINMNLSAPVATAASNESYNQFTANWISAPNTKYYALDVATDSLFVNILPNYNGLNVGTTKSFKISDLANGGVYYYRVRSGNSCGTGINSNTIKADLNPWSASALPVNFLEFNVSSKNGSAKIQWSTASEINNNFFTVEKSNDGVNFEMITTVKGAGNSNTAIAYNAIDNNMTAGTSYYRIKQTDYNNNSTYSAIASINNTNNAEVAVYPNPATSNDEINVALTGMNDAQITVSIRDLQGMEYFSKTVAGSIQTISINHQMAPGMYIVAVSSENNNYSQKVLVK